MAARNEEQHIRECLEAIHQLSYPDHQLEVLIGNDQSEDRTADVVRQFIRDKPHFRLYDIAEPMGHQRGKANVLAQLVHHSRGEYLFFTDADTCVPTGWVEAMLAECQDGIGIVTGVTTVTGSRLFDRLQALDWLQSLGLINAAAERQIPLTAMGNNMLVSRWAYTAVGGYEGLPFSLVEDWQLFTALVAHGFGFRNLLQANVLARTRPATTLTAWLHQRKRWMLGAVQLPWYIVGGVTAWTLLTPAILGLTFFFPVVAASIFVAKMLIQWTFAAKVLHRLNQQALIRCLPIYQLYEPLASLAQLVFYLLPVKVKWKGRRFQ